ncbi:phage integrase central domain-containing protein, partial [Trinickia dinghuensis]
MTLSDTLIRKAKPGAKPVKLFDGGGLYVLLTPTGSRFLHRLERDMFSSLGRRPIAEITPLELLTALRRIERRGAIDTAHRSLQKCGQIFRYAVVTGRVSHDPTTDLHEALKPAPKQHYASITDPKEVGALMRAIRGYAGGFETKCALFIGILTFVRPGELRKAEWSE